MANLPAGTKTRKYVDVIARWHESGRVEPMSICWPDGRTFQIDQVIGKPASSAFENAPARILRYVVRIGTRTTHLFLEINTREGVTCARWFVEALPARQPWRFGCAGCPTYKPSSTSS